MKRKEEQIQTDQLFLGSLEYICITYNIHSLNKHWFITKLKTTSYIFLIIRCYTSCPKKIFMHETINCRVFKLHLVLNKVRNNKPETVYLSIMEIDRMQEDNNYLLIITLHLIQHRTKVYLRSSEHFQNKNTLWKELRLLGWHLLIEEGCIRKSANDGAMQRWYWRSPIIAHLRHEM